MPKLSTLSIGNGTLLNEAKIFELRNLNNLESIEIGNNCFSNVDEFIINGLNELKSMSIGSNSFTGSLNSYGNNYAKSFHILNCAKLESIEIGRYSFSDYAGEFELKNLPKLQSLIIGSSTSISYNFYNTNSLIIEGILIID